MINKKQILRYKNVDSENENKYNCDVVLNECNTTGMNFTNK